MPTIDLDQPVRDASNRRSRRHPGPYVLLSAALLLFGLAGEPEDAMNSIDESTLCPAISALGNGVSGGIVAVDPATGELVRTTYCSQ